MNVRRAAADVVELCRERGFDPVVVALSFCIGHPYVASTLVGMSTREQVDTNLKALNFEISPAFLAEIEQVVAPAKNVVWHSGRDENAEVIASYKSQEQLQ
jgi:L-galactose dehydrogenase